MVPNLRTKMPQNWPAEIKVINGEQVWKAH